MKTERSATTRARADRILRLVERGGIRRVLRGGEGVDFSVLLLLKREVESLVRIDTRRALKLATVMEQLVPFVPDERARAVASRAKAEALMFLGRYRKALEKYRETVRLFEQAGDPLEGARASVGQISALAYLSRYREALRVARRAKGILHRHGDRPYLGRLYGNTGSLYFHMDRYREALENYRKSRRYLSGISGRDETVVTLEINEGVIHTNLDHMGEAESVLDRAIARAREMGWHSLAAQGEFNIATVYHLASRYQEALAALSRAAVVFEDEDKSLAAIADATRAEIYLRLNMAAEAAALAREAISRFRIERMRYDKGLALYTLGVALARQGRSSEGERSLLAAKAFFDREGNRVRSAVIDLHLARLLVAKGRWRDARRRARQAERSFSGARLAGRAALARLTRAEVELLAGRPDSAGRLLRGVPPLADRLARFEIAFLRGRIAEASGRSGAALAAYRRALAFADTVRASLAGEEHKIAVEGFRAEVSERAISLLLIAGRRGARRAAGPVSPGDSEVFEVVEGGKAQSLWDLLDGLSLAKHGSRSSRASKPSRLAEAMQELSWYVSKLDKEQMSGPTGVTFGPLSRKVARLEREVAALHRREREQAPTGEIAPGSLTPAGREKGRTRGIVGLEEACALLGDDEVVIEYFTANGRLHAFRIEPGGARIVALEATGGDIEKAVLRFRFHIDTMRLAGPTLARHAGSLAASARASLREAHALLLGPLGEIPGGSRVTFISHGSLHHIPFPALEGPEGPIAERAKVAWAPSFAIFARLRARRASTRRLDLVGGHADPRAPEIVREIEAVGHALRGRSRVLRPSLDSDEFLRLAPRARRIHLATHGRFRPDNPLFSAVRLADRWVHLYEILNLDLDADLVVLSGCETGAGRRYAGEEILGLARGFLARGARRLVVSLWPVDDPSAARLIALFHEAHAAGIPARESLQRASLAIRQEHPHPFYWSPFILVGTGPTRGPTTAPRVARPTFEVSGRAQSAILAEPKRGRA